MLRIPCPFCGTRDETEFRFGGESHVQRPGLEVSDAEWADYLFNRDNPKGLHSERWFHTYGCRQWFNVVRDTVTHEIHAVYEMGAAKPDIAIMDHD
jgi:heterotetrameric sarcosine oxidase delta subunit